MYRVVVSGIIISIPAGTGDNQKYQYQSHVADTRLWIGLLTGYESFRRSGGQEAIQTLRLALKRFVYVPLVLTL